MADEDITKGKKGKKPKGTRRRSGRFYISNAHPLPSPEELAALAGQFPSDDAVEDCATPDVGKGTMGNAVPPSSGRGPVTDRLAPSRVVGGAAPSTGDHNASAFNDPMNQPGPRALAYGHPDVRQSNTNFNDVVARLRTVNGDNQNGDRDITYRPGEVGLSLFNARGQAGSYPGMQPVGHSPQRPDYHQARQSPVPPTPGHSLADPRSHAAPMAAKSNSELRADFKRMLFPGSGGGR